MPNNRTTTVDNGITVSPGDRQVSEPGVYMELRSRPSQGQSHVPSEYQSIQDIHVTPEYYNIGFKEGNLGREDEEVYEIVGDSQS